MSRRAALRDQRSDLNRRLIGAAAGGDGCHSGEAGRQRRRPFADLEEGHERRGRRLLRQVYQDALKMSSGAGKSFEDVVAIMTSRAQAGLGKTREEMNAGRPDEHRVGRHRRTGERLATTTLRRSSMTSQKPGTRLT